MRNFWRIGFLGQLSCVVLATVLAYTGLIPTHLAGWPHADWVGHFLGFGLLGFFLEGMLRHRPLFSRRGVVLVKLAPVLVLGAAAIEELAQGLSPRRTSSFADFACDAIGVLIATWLAARVTRYVDRATSTRATYA